ncbi:FimV/HubP family polar landmark protein [Wohlfahrtiimonas chitiniclastica]|uniref:FimV/HubP family polar landmark protein n=1 Tax=Wohlfahrtiimonas chitiniclastica TaxID=400946 RepID=UPI001BCA8C08|nr:FimV/HubP family polar landmark protein [Wohlfahrtiimonas chitiniclastica]MBS7817635.1 hypothetical protein [Wohlfahrtiimonas chitiniclastica]MBS7823466.1 hypothetical protein [Wohlfahrtiimonas chitiniclastica]MBS7831240.1 hypothetical protein [Wohlfahrtiimonas chitiniclastica]MBS7833207.1 hypothetical protein [Wohlfahrtiimonas chitiniclastica]
MIRKNILAIALLGVFGLSHAADVENLRTISYLNEPLRLQADVIGEGDVILAERTEYLRLNHPIPTYDLSVNVVEEEGKKQLVVTTTEEVETPALTLLLESRDENNRRQLFELPILLDIRPEPAAEVAEIEIDGVNIESDQATESTNQVTLSDVPVVAPVAPKVADAKDADTQPKVAEVKKPVEKAVVKAEQAQKKVEKASTDKKADKPAKVEAKAPKAQSHLKNTVDPALVKRYGPVEAGETMWSIANKVRPAHIPPQKMIEIIKKHNPSAFTPAGVLRADVTLIIPVETPKKQHNFVKAEATTEAVGFIYELPAPPASASGSLAPTAANVAPAAVAAEVVDNDGAVTETVVTDEVPVKVVHPVNSPANDMTVISPSEPSIAAVNDVPADVAPAEPQVEAQGDEMSASVAAETVDATTPAQSENVTASVAEVTESVANVAPAKPKVFMVEEPEEEPGIIEIIFDNIMYVGGGALILLLAILAIVAMRRRQAGEGSTDKAPKAPKEKKAKKGKKSEAPAEEAVIVEEIIEEAPKKGAPEVKSASAKAAVAAAIATPVAAVLSSEGASPAKDGTEIQSLDFDFSFTEEKPQAVAAPKDADDDMAALDFDLSFAAPAAAAVTAAAVTATQADEKPQEAEFDTLDFDFSFDAPSETPSAAVETAAAAEPEMGGLEFDLSGFEAPKAEAEAESVEEMPTFDTLEFDGVLDFTGRNTEEVLAESEPVVEAVEAEVATVEPAMDFEPIAFDPIAVEEVTPSDEPEAVSFGENNPLFVSQDSDSGAIEAIASEENNDPTAEITEYVSFGDLIDTAQTTLANDEQVADISAIDLAKFEEDDAIEFADLMEVSTEEVGHNLDLSFVADVDDNEAGHEFLESLDFSAPADIDPIGDSVKDNVAKAEESLEHIRTVESVAVPEVADMPEIITEEIVTNTETAEAPQMMDAVDEMDFPSFDLSEFEAPIAETIETVDAFEGMEPLEEIELIDIPAFTESTPEPVIITEPVATAPAVPIVETVVEAAPVVAPVAPTVIEKEVMVEKPVVQVVEVPVAEASEDDESEQIKLELAEAYIDFDPSLAKPLLEEVVRDGNPSQVARAEALLSKIN